MNPHQRQRCPAAGGPARVGLLAKRKRPGNGDDGSEDHAVAADEAPVAPAKAAKKLDVDIEGVDEVLTAMREEYAYDFGDDDEMCIYTLVRGGKWTVKENGVAADSVTAYAKKDLAANWCVGFGFPKQTSFAFGK